MRQNKIKVILALLIVTILTITGCSKDTPIDNNDKGTEKEQNIVVDNDDSEEEEQDREEKLQDETEEQPEEDIDVDLEELKEVVNMNIGSGDTLKDINVEGKDIFIKVVLEDNDKFEPIHLASNRYSSITDELLENSYWENISVEFVDIGTVSMHSSQATDSGYGRCFESLDIDKILNNN